MIANPSVVAPIPKNSSQKPASVYKVVKTIKPKAKRAALVWKEFGLTAGYHSYRAPAAKGSYIIIPTFDERKVFNGYLASQLVDCDARNLCGKPGIKKLDEAKAIAQADHDAGRDR